MHVEFWLESQKERDHKEDLDIGGRMTLKWILDIIRLIWLSTGTSEHSKEPLGSIKYWEVLE
jgi:hypothetical protein